MKLTSDTLQSPAVYGQGKYPFTDGSTMTSTDGVEVPPFWATDAHLYPPGGTATQYINSISITSKKITITVADENGKELCRGECKANDNQVVLYDEYHRVSGLLLGNMQALQSVATVPSELVFSENALSFVASVVVPQSATEVTGFLTSEDEILYGDVWLVGEDGIVFKDEGNGIVRMHVVGDPNYVRRACNEEDQDFPSPKPLQKIIIEDDGGNTQTLLPGEDGEILIMPGDSVATDNVLRVANNQNKLLFYSVADKV